MSVSIRLIPSGEGVQPTLTVPVPAIDVVTTTLVITNDVKELPTLSSVEHIIGRLSVLGLVLADQSEGDRIARLINKKFLPLPQEMWRDQDLRLHVQRADSEGAPEALQAVGALRAPVLEASDTVLKAGGAYGPAERRANEIRLVDEMSAAIIGRKPVWQKYGRVAASFVGKTVLDQLVKQLIGVPVSDLIRSTLKNADRLVF